MKFGTILNSSCPHSYKQGSVTFTAASHRMAIKLFRLYFSGKAFWRSKGNLHSTVDTCEQVECWRALKSSPADKNKCNMCIHHELVYSSMFYLLLLSWNWPVWYSQWSTTLACAIDGKIMTFQQNCLLLPLWVGFVYMADGRVYKLMKWIIHMDHRSTLESIKLFMFNLKPLW